MNASRGQRGMTLGLREQFQKIMIIDLKCHFNTVKKERKKEKRKKKRKKKERKPLRVIFRKMHTAMIAARCVQPLNEHVHTKTL